MKRVLPLLVALAAALAGCANNDDAPASPTAGTTPATQARQVTNEEARALVEAAAAGLPERYGYSFSATKGGMELVTATGSFDNVSKATYTSLKGEPSAFGGLEALADGISIYSSSDGAVYVLGGVALVQASSASQLEGIVPAGLFQPDALVEGVRDNVTVKTVRATTWKGAPALEVTFETTEEGGATSTGTATLTQAPTRLHHLEVQTASTGDRNDPFAGALIKVDILYDDIPAVPEAITRALTLGYDPGAPSQDGSQTWTFLHDSGIALDGVHVFVQDSTGENTDPQAAMTLVQMALSEGTASGAGFTVTYEDKDADATVSTGDRLVVSVDDSAETVPQVVLHDAQTDQYLTADFLVVFRMLFAF